MVHKRKNYLEWQEYFMSIAFLSAQRSKDPSTQVGACIVNKENKVVGIGYNGMPIGCDDDVMPWNKLSDSTNKENWLNSKLPYVCHAELNAVLNKNCADVKGCIIFVALFPCNLCSQIIIQSGITEVVYYCDRDPDKSETRAAKRLLDLAGITYRQFVPKQSQVVIDFSLIEATTGSVPILSSQPQLMNGHANDSELEQETTVGSGRQPDRINVDGKGAPPTKRSNYLEWEEYFMAMAFLSAQRSKDPRTQVGACIVNGEKKIVGIGYNGMPIGCNDDVMPWNRAADGSDVAWLESKSPYVCHAELNAVLNKNAADIKGCSIYVALFPCNKCAQVVIQSGIREVVYYSDKYHSQPEFHASRHMLSTAGVKYRQFRLRQEKIIIDFGINSREMQKNSQSVKNQADSSTDDQGKAIEICKENGHRKNLNGDPDVSNNKTTCASILTNNNNIGNAEPSASLSDLELQDLVDENDPNNFPVNDANLQASLELGWLHEVKEIRFALLTIFVAAVAVLLSWHAELFGMKKNTH